MMGTAQMPGGLPTPEILPAGMSAAHDPKLNVAAREPLERALALPCTLTLEVPVVSFTVGAMLALEVGSIVETAAQQNEDLPLTVNGQLVGMVEIEVVGENLAVRLAGVA